MHYAANTNSLSCERRCFVRIPTKLLIAGDDAATKPREVNLGNILLMHTGGTVCVQTGI